MLGIVRYRVRSRFRNSKGWEKMSVLQQVLFVLINIVMAWYHSDLIKANKPIYHGLWGGLYLGAAALVAYLHRDWTLLVALLCIRKSVFDVSLNLFRGKPMWWKSKTTTSIIDKLLYKFDLPTVIGACLALLI